MKKGLLIIAALVLTLPVYIGIANIRVLEEWFLSGAGWKAFEPLFRLCNAIGIRGDGNILMTIMTVISFLVSLITVVSVLTLLHKFHPRWRR